MRVGSGSPYEQECGFSRAVRTGDRVLVAGTAPMDEAGNSFGIDDPAAQMWRCLTIISEALAQAGAELDDVVRTRIFLTRPEDWPLVAAVHGEFFSQARPAATCVVVNALLRPEWLLEVEAEAVISTELRCRPFSSRDRQWIREQSPGLFGADYVVSRGLCHTVADQEGFMAWRAGLRVGLLTYRPEGEACEVITLDALERQQGVGTALMAVFEAKARSLGCRRAWLITTNDNLEALRFYQRRGYTLSALHRGAIAKSRRLKPSIPAIGGFGIGINDELELARDL